MTIHPDHHVPITASSKASAPRIGGPLIALAIAVMLGVGIAVTCPDRVVRLGC